MASTNIRVDYGLKEHTYSVLAQIGLSPTEALHSVYRQTTFRILAVKMISILLDTIFFH